MRRLATIGLLVATLALATDARAQAPASSEAQTTQESDPEPRYAIARPSAPCLGKPCGWLQIVDASYRARSPRGRQRGGLRLLVGRRLYLGGEIGAGRRMASLTTTRFEARYERRPGRVDTASAEWRASRIRVRLAGVGEERQRGRGWTLDGVVALRASPTLEIGLGAVADLNSERPGLELTTRRGGHVFARWQPGWRHEIEARLSVERVRSAIGLELERLGAEARWEGLLAPFRLRLGLGYERLSGVLGRSEASLDADVRARVAPRLTVDAGWSEALEPGLASVRRGFRAGIALHARRFRFARGGSSGPAVDRLVRAAFRHGYNEARVFGVAGRRALRERLTLSDIDELTDLAGQLHRATIADRNVPLVALGFAWDKDLDIGARSRSVSLTLGVPRPAALPWIADESSVELVSVRLRYEEVDITAGLREYGRSAALSVRLHRELELHADWNRPARSALQIALGVEPSARLRVGISYAFGR